MAGALAPAPGYVDAARLPYPFCPGCGHGRILDALNGALGRLGRDPNEIVIVTDIGCVGLSDQYFVTNGFHGLHGRSVTYATGIKLARDDLVVVVLIGDGGCGIGGHHLIHAARRNVGVTVLVFNNFNFGMTGGQHSVMTPIGGRTATTPAGNLEYPLDVAATVAANGASYAARTTAFDPELPDRIHEAITTPGFALVDVWELCTAYFVPNNDFSRKAMERVLAESGLPSGVVTRRQRPEYSRALREQAEEADGSGPSSRGGAIEVRFASPLRERRAVVLAGAAGQKVRSAASALGRAAVMSGLFATQRDDYPVTVMTGHSVSDVILSPEPILYTGVLAPDVLVILAPEGLRQVRGQAGRMSEKQRIYVDGALAGQLPPTRAQVLSMNADPVARRSFAAAAVAAVAERERLVDPAALEAAVSDARPAVAEENLKAIRARRALFG